MNIIRPVDVDKDSTNSINILFNNFTDVIVISDFENC